MLPYLNRLPSADVTALMRHGKRVSDDNLQLIYAPGRAAVPRFAFVVSTKIDKRATGRNRIKRLMRESIQRILARLSAIDGMCIARKGLAGKTQQEMDAIVETVLTKNGLLRV